MNTFKRTSTCGLASVGLILDKWRSVMNVADPRGIEICLRFVCIVYCLLFFFVRHFQISNTVGNI